MAWPFRDVFVECDVQKHVDAGDLAPVIARLTDELARGRTPFASARTFDFTTSTSEVRDWLATCARLIQEQHSDYPCLYTEMNGFDLNPDRWFASIGPLRVPASLDSDTWSYELDMRPFPPYLTLSGAEEMQDAFVWWRSTWATDRRDDLVEREEALAEWLVWAKWLVLFQTAWLEGPIPLVRVPIIVTAHDYDIALLLAPPPQAT